MSVLSLFYDLVSFSQSCIHFNIVPPNLALKAQKTDGLQPGAHTSSQPSSKEDLTWHIYLPPWLCCSPPMQQYSHS